MTPADNRFYREATPGDMAVIYKLTSRQSRAFVLGMALCGALLFGIGFAIGIMWPQIAARF